MASQAWEYYENFLSWDIERQNQELLEQPPEFWEQMGAEKALETFRRAAERVPAYKAFLASNQIDSEKIQTVADLKLVPPTNKKNYLRAYPLRDLCWDGNLEDMHVVSVSSGSTGEPFFWPRNNWQEKEVDHYYELVMRYVYDAATQHSLVIIAFAMGMYIAGPFTFASLLRIAEKGYPTTITTPSNDIAAVLRVVKNLGPQFDQIIIGGYPPLVKDIIDRGAHEGIDWAAKRTRLFFGGEGFSEQWRDHVHTALQEENILRTTTNMYGTADSALVGIETPVSVAYRRIASLSKQFREINFHSDRLPSIMSYNPIFKYFETTDEGSLLFTSSSGTPLIRYEIGDVGGIVPYADIHRQTKEASEDISTVLSNHGASANDWKLPLVYLFGRHDFTVHLYGANIYPENIKEALEDHRISKSVTGKFIATTKYGRTMNPYLDLRVELAPGVKAARSLTLEIKKVIIEVLREKNAEYEDVYTHYKKRAEPRLTVEEHGGQDFKINIKHSWINRLKS